MTLPLFVNKKNKFVAGGLMYLSTYIFYYLTNHFPIYEPVTLPHTWIDANAPWWPYTILIYTSEYIYFAFVFFTLRDYDNINRYLYAFFCLETVSCLIFLFYPTIFPREPWPVDPSYPQWLQSMWTWLRTQDAPTNCLPSLHVSTVLLSAFAFKTDGVGGRPKLFKFYTTWGILIALSTLTTKQHYLADIVTGAGMAVFFYWWFHHKQRYVRINESRS